MKRGGRSGSHYTPRELTEPIVRIALEPIFDRLQQEAGGPLRPKQILDLKVCDPAMGSGAFLVEACRQLADALIESWRAHSVAPDIPPDEDEVIFARRQVAQRCLYGVDRNPKAVDLAKLSLWLTTLAKEHPLTFLDHALRHGDSLVGLSIPQVQAFHWKGDAPHFEEGFEALKGRTHLNKSAELRQLIRQADDSVDDGNLTELWDKAQSETAAVRLLGDLVIAAFFDKSKPKDREARRKELAADVIDGESGTYRAWLDDLRSADPPLAPFHWQIEFPEVFDRDNPGFDSIVGNPPFLGGKRISTVLGSECRDWLSILHNGANRNADLVAHFFRRSFDLIRISGTSGLIATNTIAQGDTRAGGLRWICTNSGEIYSAQRRVKWPGSAAVVVSVIHTIRGQYSGSFCIDDVEVKKITAFLFHRGSNDDPLRLEANKGKSFVGSFLRGMGFTFDDTVHNDAPSPLSEMERLVDEDPRNREALSPYIGGEELNSHPTHSHHRYAINFRNYPLRRAQLELKWAVADDEQRGVWLRAGVVPSDYPASVAEDWPELLRVVEQNVKPYREALGNSSVDRNHKHRWWNYANDRPLLRDAIGELERVLANSQVSQRVQFAFLPSKMVYGHTLNVYPLDTYAAFGTLQSSLHEIWASFFASSLEERLRYTPSDCFETFPFLHGWETRTDLEMVGQEYYEFRAALMVRNDEGMTKTYNRFHDPYEDGANITELRRLHAVMDRAVLDAYGWSDISTDCEFLLDYEIDEETRGNRKKPYRYRWPDDIRNEVLARLLELNGEFAAEEARASLTKPTRSLTKRRRKSPGPAPTTATAPSSTLWDTDRSGDHVGGVG